MDWKLLLPDQDKLVGYIAGFFMFGMIFGFLTVAGLINYEQAGPSTEELPGNTSNYSERTCELAKWKTNATIYYNHSLDMCIAPKALGEYNHSVNDS